MTFNIGHWCPHGLWLPALRFYLWAATLGCVNNQLSDLSADPVDAAAADVSPDPDVAHPPADSAPTPDSAAPADSAAHADSAPHADLRPASPCKKPNVLACEDFESGTIDRNLWSTE